MCGIAGIFSLNGRPIQNTQNRIWRMTMMLERRGPDSQGVYISPDNFLALGNTRLAIVDPSCPIKQPLETSDGKAVLSFNGEIYNYLDTMERLKRRGVSFRSRMDTEVLLEGLRLENENLLNDLDGMWTFAYYEVNKRRLLISRDILGERHLFYRIDEKKGELIFASEVKPLLVDAGHSFDIDFEALATSLQFYSAPPGRTLVEGIKRLLPGHNIALRVGGDPKIYRYRRLHPEKWFDFFNTKPSLEEVITAYEDIFHRTCKRRLPLDVPFISTLSGGLDSAIICAFASDLGKKRIKTLYAQSSEKHGRNTNGELDEFTASKFTSQKFNTEHIHIKINNDECVPVLNRLAEDGFDGMIDPGVASFEILAHQVKKENVKVILISDGPDELLGGYVVDQKAYNIDRIFERYPLNYHALAFISSTKIGRLTLRSLKHKELIISPLTSYRPFRFEPIHQSHSPLALNDILEDSILSASRCYGMPDSVYSDILPKLDYSQKRALSYAATTLPDHFNRRSDKAFMRASIESRLPFQAPEMVEFTIAMPGFLRFDSGNTTKYLMRKIVERRVGPEIASRSKHGFSAPLWKSPNVYKAMKFEEVIRESPIFKDLPFKHGTRDLIFSPKHKKMLWPFFVFAKTYEQLKRGVYD